MRTARLRARRLSQTTQFANPTRVLFDLASSRTPWRRDELHFALRDDTVIVAPNEPGARVPVYEIFVEDAYRLPELTAGLRDDAVAIDVGGHIGCFSVALAKALPQASVHTYEASPYTVEWTRRNVSANGLDRRVHVHACALAGHTGHLSFADNGHASGLNGITAPASSSIVQVPCRTFEEAVKAAGGRVDLVKLDTEGAEYDIVLSSPPQAWATVQRVVLEYHDVPGHSASELEKFFGGAGLTVSHRVGEKRVGALWLTRDGSA
jgi:FkbM family methyltransferase